MTFKCEMCEQTSKPREKMHKLFTGVRRKAYSTGPESFSTGFEPTKEIKLCGSCLTEVQQVEK